MFIELHDLGDGKPALINTSAIEAVWSREDDEDEYYDGIGGTIILLQSDSGRYRVSESYETVKALILRKEGCL